VTERAIAQSLFFKEQLSNQKSNDRSFDNSDRKSDRSFEKSDKERSSNCQNLQSSSCRFLSIMDYFSLAFLYSNW